MGLKCIAWNALKRYQKWTLSSWPLFCLFDRQEHNQRLQSSYASYKEENVINQQENKRLLEENTNLQQEIMQMQKEKEKLYSDIVSQLQENNILQTKVEATNAPWNLSRLSRIMCWEPHLDIFLKVAVILQVTEQGNMQQTIKTQHEFEKTKVESFILDLPLKEINVRNLHS